MAATVRIVYSVTEYEELRRERDALATRVEELEREREQERARPLLSVLARRLMGV